MLYIYIYSRPAGAHKKESPVKFNYYQLSDGGSAHHVARRNRGQHDAAVAELWWLLFEIMMIMWPCEMKTGNSGADQTYTNVCEWPHARQTMWRRRGTPAASASDAVIEQPLALLGFWLHTGEFV